MATPDYATESKNITDTLQSLYDQVHQGYLTVFGTGGVSNPMQNTQALSSQLDTASNAISTLKSTTLTASNEAAWLDAANSTSDSLQAALVQLGNTSITSTANSIAKNLNKELKDAASAASTGLTAGVFALVLLLGLYVFWKVS